MDLPIVLTSSVVDCRHLTDGFAIVGSGYPSPIGIPAVTLDEAMEAPGKLRGTMVIVGLSRMMTPSNRAKVDQVFHRPWDGLRRVCVDDRLFWGDPWRMWWLFFAVRHNPWGFTDSYLAEGRWKAAKERQTEDPFCAGPVLSAMRGVVDVRPDAFRFGPIHVDERPVSADVHAEYAREKEAAFTDEKTLPAILKRLSAVAQRALPERAVPSPSRFFAAPPRQIVCTNLAVDRFLVGDLLERRALTNAVANAGRAND